ncbi:hypothetical protein GE09DRAFT_91873 [Coniochaeta sp. 2T2.1]|nr:hypothetical protein GE09DRAFT_91873 [Coniochaeta sp. 2T2.1]
MTGWATMSTMAQYGHQHYNAISTLPAKEPTVIDSLPGRQCDKMRLLQGGECGLILHRAKLIGVRPSSTLARAPCRMNALSAISLIILTFADSDLTSTLSGQSCPNYCRYFISTFLSWTITLQVLLELCFLPCFLFVMDLGGSVVSGHEPIHRSPSFIAS